MEDLINMKRGHAVLRKNHLKILDMKNVLKETQNHGVG